MRIKTILAVLLFILPVAVFAQGMQRGGGRMNRDMQGDGQDKKQVEADRVGVYTRILNLTPAEAQKFWPVFNAYQDELEKNRAIIRQKREDVIKNYDKMTDAAFEGTIDEFTTLAQNELDIRKKYIVEFKKVLPVRKVILLQKAEMEFKRELLHSFRDHHGRDEN